MVVIIEPAAGCTESLQRPETWHTNVKFPFFSSVSPAMFYTARAATRSTRFQSTPATYLAVSHRNLQRADIQRLNAGKDRSASLSPLRLAG